MMSQRDETKTKAECWDEFWDVTAVVAVRQHRRRQSQAGTTGDVFTRGQFMIYQQVITGNATPFQAAEAVSSWAIDHPEVDLEEQMTWAEWEAQS